MSPEFTRGCSGETRDGSGELQSPPEDKPEHRRVKPAAHCSLCCTRMMAMDAPEPKAYRSYRWIVADPRMLGGAPTIRGTRYSVEHVLEAMAAGMTPAEVERAFGLPIPP